MKKLFTKDIFGGRLGRSASQGETSRYAPTGGHIATNAQIQQPESKPRSFWGKVKNFFKEAVPIALNILTVISTALSVMAKYRQLGHAHAA